MTTVKFLRIDDRLIHGQVIVGWLPEIKPDKLIVVNDKISDDFMRQDLMSLSVPPDIELEFYSTSNLTSDVVTDDTFILVSSPADACSCLDRGIAPKRFNVGGMHSRDGKEEIFEALHVDSEDRKNFSKLIELGVTPIFQPTPQNVPMQLGDIL
ncbi:MAG: PTS sugar transporter subunit IIB [Candidatus Riflebacteria bacterium]|nr:PTS sugar transporter subunit IIB [Candidatus Riflebacteria bacterium]